METRCRFLASFCVGWSTSRLCPADRGNFLYSFQYFDCLFNLGKLLFKSIVKGFEANTNIVNKAFLMMGDDFSNYRPEQLSLENWIEFSAQIEHYRKEL